MFEEFIHLLKAFVFGELYRLLGFLENNMRRIQGSTLEYSVSVNVIFGKKYKCINENVYFTCLYVYVYSRFRPKSRHTHS